MLIIPRLGAAPSDAARAAKAKASLQSSSEHLDLPTARKPHAETEFALRDPQLLRRLDSRLISASRLASEQGELLSAKSLSDRGIQVEGTKVVVIVQCETNANPQEVATSLISRNADVVRTGEGHVKAVVPISVLEEIAGLPGVSFVRPPMRSREKNTVMTEGRAATLANSWNAAGFTGQGVKVAVLDDGFAGLATRKANNEIPSNAIEMDFTGTGISSGTSVHGCACAEVIYDLAPGVQLYLIKAADPSDDEAAKNYCKTQGVQIISFSGGYDAMNFHDGIAYSSITPHPVAIANDAAANGILWVNAAGNEQSQQAVAQWRDANANSYLDWSSLPNSINELWNGGDPIPAGTELLVFLTWNAWPVTAQDFDLDLYKSSDGVNWTYVISAEDTQNGTQPPREELDYIVPTTARYGVGVYKYSANTSPWFILRSYPYEVYYYGYNNYLTPGPGSICIPADAASVFSVGAIYYTNYTAGPIEFFSSLGPNNGSYTGNPIVTKPDICGPDGISTVSYGATGFEGTSAATPHIAALAALVKGRFPAYNNTQIRSYLESYGVDLGTAGKDNTFGSGPCVLPLAVIAPPVVTLTKLGANVILSWPTNSVGFTLQWSTNLNSQNWSNATPLPSIVNGLYAVTNAVANNARFYRLRK